MGFEPQTFDPRDQCSILKSNTVSNGKVFINADTKL